MFQQLLPELADDLRLLQRQRLDGDVPGTLNKIRYIAEKLFHGVCLRETVSWGQAEPTLERMLGPLQATQVLPKNIAILARTIQGHTSPGSHFQESELTETHVDIAQQALVGVLGWYASASRGRPSKQDAAADRTHD